MGIRHDLEQQLNQVPPGSGPRVVHVDVDGGRLDCEVSQVDAIGCSVDKLELHSDRLKSASPDRLKRVSDKLADGVRYLLEPIAPVECDSDAGMIRMRSNPPTRDEEGTKYYEVDVNRQEGVVFSRFRSKLGESRENIPADVTRETLGRLAEDIADSVNVK